MFKTVSSEGVIARAVEKNIIDLQTVALREFSVGDRRDVDDRPAGGGDGMVLRADVMDSAIESVRTPQSFVVCMTPAGKVFDDSTARQLSEKSHIILLCGRYSGFDERVLERHVDLHLSVGDFVLSGGELPAMCVIDAVARHVPGVLGNAQSAFSDSFADGLLEAPSYTKPSEFYGKQIPDVFLTGDHKKIAEYRRKESLRVTAQRRPDLLLKIWDSLSRSEKAYVNSFLKNARL